MRRSGTRGSMPFSIIAVTILLVSVASVAVTASYQDASDGTEGTEDDISAVDEALETLESFINRGMGEIIYSISTDDDLGGLDARVAEFDEWAAEWFGFQFPSATNGVSATVVDYEVELSAVAVTLSDDGEIAGYTPTYLKATGTVTLSLSSQHGSATAEVEVSSDGSYALPLADARGSLFESMVGGAGISISQMMAAQLTALAEYRIANGYGAINAYGERSTDAIITSEDVLEAYAICMEAISAICFRDADSILAHADCADLADLLISDDGTITIDLSAVYAQALLSAVDDVALRWMDYFYGFEVIEKLDELLNPFKNALSALFSFVSGDGDVNGADYLSSAMEAAGYSEDEWRYVGQGATTVELGGYTMTFSNPTTDILSLDWLIDFEEAYESEGNYVEDYVVNVLKSAAVMLAERSDLGTITAEVDAYDTEGFLETLSALFEAAVDDCNGAVGDAVESCLSDATVYDEFYGSLADEIISHAEEFVLEDEFYEAMRSALEIAVDDARGKAEASGSSFEEPDVDELLESYAALNAFYAYRSTVYEDLALFESLKTVEAEDDGLVKTILTWICSYGLEAIDVLTPMEEKVALMMDEILGIDSTNPYSGSIELPGTTLFTLIDDDGNEVVEALDATISMLNTTVAVSLDESQCVHTVGWRDELSAAYSTVFTVTLKGLVAYSVEGSSALAGKLGTYTSAYSDSFEVDLEIEIAVSSGWALAGVTYEASDTVLDDLWSALLDSMEDIIEPLRQILASIREAATVISEALLQISGFASDYAIRLYEALMSPLETLKEMIEDYLEEMLSEAVLEVLVDIDLGSQEIELSYFGCTLTLSTSMATWVKTTKTVLKAELSVPVGDLTVKAGINVKLKGDLAAENLRFTYTGGVEAEDWDVDFTLDPLMKNSKYLFTVDGEVDGTEFSIVAPKLENYYEMGLALSDVDGLAEILDSIPVPGLGVSIGLDAGFSLRYATPIETSLIINEFESNPEGNDSGNEWVEILNNGETTIDLEGYELVAASDKKTKRMTLSGTLSPGERMVVYTDFTLVNSSGKSTKSGEGLKLYDADGNLVDETPIKADTANDDNTWQRKFDGSSEWVFTTGTQDKANAGSITGALITPAEMKECVWDAVTEAFDSVGSIQDVDTLVSFVEYLVQYTVENVVGVVSSQIIDASVYVSVDVSDATGSLAGGVRVAFRTDGDLLEDVLLYIAGELEAIIFGIESPYSIDPLEAFTEHVDLEVCVGASVGFPSLLSSAADLPEVSIELVFRANLASLTDLAGTDTGDPEIEFGLVIRNCPTELIPSKLTVKKDMDQDLWLFKATVSYR